MVDLSKLIGKVKAATGPDRGLDMALLEMQGWSEMPEGHRLHGIWVREIWEDCFFDGEQPHYTASVDAALDLVERCLPGWDYSIENMHEDGCYGKVWKNGWHDDTFVAEVAPTAPLAILLAAFTALLSLKDKS